MSLGTRLRALRLERGLSQRELAEPLYTHAYISTIETGRRDPSDEAIKHFSRKLGVAIEQLRSGRPPGLEAEVLMKVQEGRRKASAGDFAAAHALFRHALDESKRFKLVRLRASALCGQGIAHELSGNPERAAEFFDQAIDAVKQESPVARVDAVTGKARVLHMLGETRYATHIVEGLVNVLESESITDPDALIRLHSSLVHLYFEGGLFDRAYAAAEFCLGLADRAKDPEKLANMHLNAARAFIYRGEFEDATRSLTKAGKLFEELDFKSDLGRAHLAMGHMFARRNSESRAEKELKIALDLFRESGSDVNVGRSSNELARLYRLKGKTADATRLLNRTIDTLTEESHAGVLAWAHRELGLVLQGTDVINAEKQLRRAVEIYERVDEPVELASAYRALGDLFEETGQHVEAGQTFKRGIMALEERL